MAKDELFGEIKWAEDGIDAWSTPAALPYFRGAGGRIHLTDDDREALPPEGQVLLRIETGEKRRPPPEPQRDAWKRILERGDALWDEAMDALIAEYQRQRPNRVRYWKVVNDERLLPRSLPETVDRETMRQMVLPTTCTVQDPDEAHGTVDVYLTAVATWWSESLNVYVRDGRVTEVTALGSFMNRKLPWIETEAFGKLRRRPGGKRQPWWGEVMLERFRSFAAVAVDRSTWDESYTRSDEATSDLPWKVARGCANLGVYAAPNQPPTAGQAAAFEAFMKGQDAYALHTIQAIFEYYTREAPALRRKHGKAAVPVLKDPAGLEDLIELTEVSVFPEERPAPVAIGLAFHGTWTGPAGLGARWRDGKLEQLGEANIAIPQVPR
jgi:hypothetical protein